MIPRLLKNLVVRGLQTSNKIQILYGPRQVGKTTLTKAIVMEYPEKRVRRLSCDTEGDFQVLNTTNVDQLKQVANEIDILIADEVQHLDNPGLTLKVLHDSIPELKILVTGSAAFELKNSVSDALTGRYFDYRLYPFSIKEIFDVESIDIVDPTKKIYATNVVEQAMLYGTYPDVYLEPQKEVKEKKLRTIVESYLFKDILQFQRIRHSQAIVQLCRALAFQVGQLVSENELANRLQIDRKTVAQYIDILEQSYVIFRIYPWSNNLRREIGKSYKVFFIDLGIRNALIGNFHSLTIRNDIGPLWENFFIAERWKLYAHHDEAFLGYFWRDYNRAEIDWIEEKNTVFHGYECKWTAARLSKASQNAARDLHIPMTIVNKETVFPPLMAL